MIKNREIQLLISSAFISFKRNRVRTFLTSLGIMIGVMSVVLLIALGLGLKNYMRDQFESMGSNLIMIMPGNSLTSGQLQSMGASMVSGVKFTEKDVRELSKLSELKYVVPLFYKNAPASHKNESKMCYLMGGNESIFPLLNIKFIAGDPFTRSSVRRKANEVVIGYNLAQDLFRNPPTAVGKNITIQNEDYLVLGVAEKKGDPEMDNGVFLPYTTSFKSLNPTKDFFSIYLGVTQKEDIPAAKKAAEHALLKNYEADEFSVVESNDLLSTVNQIFDVLNGILIAIGSISLLVGGIGIMNIMYSSITERTKEIGIRRSLGATQSDILQQFLTEAVILSLFGGLLGLLLCALIVLAVRPFFPLSLNLVAVLVAFGVSSFIGAFFGVFPAKRAAKLSPIDAIRYE